MARSAHAYVRGSTVQFYEWLEAQKRGTLPEGPPVWICGDCHAGNLGPVAGADGRIDIQIRDLDQTVIGNPAHDLIRLALSLATASRGSDLPGVTTARILEQVIEGYQAALRQDADTIDDAPELGAGRHEAVDRAFLETSGQGTSGKPEADDSARDQILAAFAAPSATRSSNYSKRPPCVIWRHRCGRAMTTPRSRCSMRPIG